MNITVPQESSRFNQDLYKTLIPTKKRTFSENMTKRRIPFLHPENNENTSTNSTIILRKPNIGHEQHSLKNRSPLAAQDEHMNIKANEIERYRKTDYNSELVTENWKLKEDIRKIKRKYGLGLKTEENVLDRNGIETAKENSQSSKQFSHNNSHDKEDEKEVSNSYDITPSSDYYSNDSLTELSTSLSHETSTENSFDSIEENIKPLSNSTFICQSETNGNKTNYYQTASRTYLEINNKENQQTKAVNVTFHLRNGIETNQPKKYLAYKPQNFQIPLIIINEIEIIDNSTETNGIETNRTKTLKVPVIPRRSGYEENKDLQKKLNEKELYKQIEIKDKVMLHLLEIALCIDFPKLKHFCRGECEKNEEGLCKKEWKLTSEKINQQEESSGILNIIWSAIKYPFVTIPNKVEKEEVKAGICKETKEVKEHRKEQKDKEISDVHEENKKGKCLKAGKDKEVNLEKLELKEENETNKAVREKLNIEMDKQNKETNVLEYKATEMQLNNKVKQVMKILEEKGVKTESNKVLKSNTIPTKSMNNNKSKDLSENKNKTNINLEDLKEPMKNQIDITSTRDMCQSENKNKTELLRDKESNKIDTKVESSKIQLQEKKCKAKKRFLFFFNKSEKTKDDDNKTEKKSEESTTEDPNKIENMEDTLHELEQAEKKISEEALEKLDMFMTDNNLLKTEQKSRNKRSDSF